jgi:hypothetical protein
MCSSCSQKTYHTPYSTPINRIQNQSIDVSCDYTIVMLQAWNEKIDCARNANILEDLNISLQDINALQGVVKSALMNQNTLCTFKSHLDSLSHIIIKIINSGAC